MKYVTYFLAVLVISIMSLHSCEMDDGEEHGDRNSYQIYKKIVFDLPDAYSAETYKEDLGIGGYLFGLKETKSTKCIEASENTPVEWTSYGGIEQDVNYKFTFKDGKLSEVKLPWNHSAFVTDFEVIKGTAAPAIFVKVQHDLYTHAELEDAKAKNQPIPEDKQAVTMWYVFFAQEGYDKSYSLFLNCDYFTKEEMLFIARSVSLQDQAFDEYYYGA